MRYISELERKVQGLQTEATTLSAQLTLLQVCNRELQFSAVDFHVLKDNFPVVVIFAFVLSLRLSESLCEFTF